MFPPDRRGRIRGVKDPLREFLAGEDLLLDLAPTSELNLWKGTGAKAAAMLTSPKGLRLWSVVKGGEWSMAGWSFSKVAKAIVQELRKFVDQYH